ncbi:hypothetical protein EAX61_04945 [Dokdonia sinensis]|uniref:Uncharacterized protein n=1 Tax=Dokdonia sinensis TaxID=2479847 RepID=A0A3M0GMR5_9FLAO|nr:hypothetical protein [Dokdonia sinensis]RMB62923.1 hypothetical protein EAX61_04945 [Dokdonia sinensis]
MSLKLLIDTLLPEEIPLFKSYLRKRNKRSSTKNIALLDAVVNGIEIKNIDTHLYGKSSRNAYHALSKRLHDNLIDFIASRSFETEASEEMEIFKLLLAARIFYEKQHHAPARKTLLKAKAKAQKIDLYSALNEIYHTQIQYAHLHKTEDLEILIADFEENQNLLLQQEKLNIAYATLKVKLKAPQADMQKTLLSTFGQYGITINNTLTFKSLYQLLEIITSAAHLISDFAGALPFITNIEQAIIPKIQDGKHLYYRIHYFYLMTNSYFRNRDFGKAQNYLSQMKTAMKEERGRYVDRFCENALLLKTLLDNYTGNSSKATATLQSHFEKTSKKNAPNPDLVLALTVFYVQQAEHKAALSTLNRLKHTDSWYLEKAGEDWLIKRDLVELIVHIELENIDLVESLLKRFRRKYKSQIKNDQRLEQFLKFATTMYRGDMDTVAARFRESVKSQLKTSSILKEDIFMLSFYAWVKSKMTGQPLYKTTLALL